jgi:hypothetical protein
VWEDGRAKGGDGCVVFCFMCLSVLFCDLEREGKELQGIFSSGDNVDILVQSTAA